VPLSLSRIPVKAFYESFRLNIAQESEIESTSRLVRISERKIARAAAILSTILAAILLIGAVVSLYFASSNGLRLGLIAAYTTFFAVTVGFLTNARQVELFGSTAA
jgi:hypothetical protein